ncbi:MAG: 30S ribosomal protein S7 [Bacteroidota bacterium]
MRKHKPKPRILIPDPRYSDPLVTQFVNNMMLQGKKSTAFGLFYDALMLVKERTKQDEYQVWRRALNNTMPQVEVKARRIGGATFQIPQEIRSKRRVSIGMKWLIRFARERSGKGFTEKLASELIAASKGEGAAVKKREDTHRMAEANKAFAHFRT